MAGLAEGTIDVDRVQCADGMRQRTASPSAPTLESITIGHYLHPFSPAATSAAMALTPTREDSLSEQEIRELANLHHEPQLQPSLVDDALIENQASAGLSSGDVGAFAIDTAADGLDTGATSIDDILQPPRQYASEQLRSRDVTPTPLDLLERAAGSVSTSHRSTPVAEQQHQPPPQSHVAPQQCYVSPGYFSRDAHYRAALQAASGVTAAASPAASGSRKRQLEDDGMIDYTNAFLRPIPAHLRQPGPAGSISYYPPHIHTLQQAGSSEQSFPQQQFDYGANAPLSWLDVQSQLAEQQQRLDQHGRVLPADGGLSSSMSGGGGYDQSFSFGDGGEYDFSSPVSPQAHAAVGGLADMPLASPALSAAQQGNPFDFDVASRRSSISFAQSYASTPAPYADADLHLPTTTGGGGGVDAVALGQLQEAIRLSLVAQQQQQQQQEASSLGGRVRGSTSSRQRGHAPSASLGIPTAAANVADDWNIAPQIVGQTVPLPSRRGRGRGVAAGGGAAGGGTTGRAAVGKRGRAQSTDFATLACLADTGAVGGIAGSGSGSGLAARRRSGRGKTLKSASTPVLAGATTGPASAPHGGRPTLAKSVSTGTPSPSEAARSSGADEDEDSPQYKCHNCAVTRTPLWRRTACKRYSLCNACGLYYKQYGRDRPVKNRPTLSTGAPAGAPAGAGTAAAGTSAVEDIESLVGTPAPYADDLLSGARSASTPTGSSIGNVGGVGGVGGGGAQGGQRCSNCAAHKTSLWRKDVSTGCTVCNACGLYKQLHGRDRPREMRKSQIGRRRRYRNLAPLSASALSGDELDDGGERETAAVPAAPLSAPAAAAPTATAVDESAGMQVQGVGNIASSGFDAELATAYLSQVGVLDLPTAESTLSPSIGSSVASSRDATPPEITVVT